MHDVLLETETGRNFAVRAAELDAVLQSADHSDRGSLPLAALHSYLEFLTHNTITGPGPSAEINTVLWLTFPIPTTATPDGALAEATRPRPNRKSTRAPTATSAVVGAAPNLRGLITDLSALAVMLMRLHPAVPGRAEEKMPYYKAWSDLRQSSGATGGESAVLKRASAAPRFKRPRWTRYPQVADDSGHAPEVPGGDCRQERGLHGTEREGIAPNGISPRWASRRHAVAGAPD